MLKIPTAFKAFIFGSAFILLLGWLSSLGSFHWINLKTHDIALKLPFAQVHDNATLLINNDLPPNGQLSKTLDDLYVRLQQLGAAKVVLLSRAHWPGLMLSELKQPFHVTFALQTEGGSPFKAVKMFNFVAIDGVYRQYLVPQGDDNPLMLYQGTSQRENAPEYLNYFIDLNTMANLSLTQALDGNLISALVKDKVVLIDLDHHSGHQRFHTPSGDAGFGQMQALAAQTMMLDSNMRITSVVPTIILMFVLFALYFFAMQLMSPRGAIAFTAVMVCVVLALSLFALVVWHTLVPIFELMAVQFASVMYLLVVERLREESTILKISADLNARLSKKVQPPSFYQSNNPWDDLHTLINQQLNLHRSIFLSKVPNDHRVQAIHALNCSIEDIKEMRRDYQRAPYSEAIAIVKPLKLTRPYFDSVDDQEWEYMCPLMFGNEVLGFWALTVIPGPDFKQAVFENNLVQFSREITELLFHRENYLRRSKKESRLFRRFLGMKLVESEYRALKYSVAMLEKRFNSLQFIFDGLSTASALYNLFGQILHANRRMDDLVRQWQLPLYSMTAHDFLVQLTGLDSQDVKQRLLQVTLHQADISIRVQLENDSAEYILRIRTINVDKDKSEQGFLLLGLLFEFVDISEAQKVISMKKDLYSQYFHQMRNNLSTLNLISRQLSRQLPDDKQQFARMLEETLEECTRVNVVIEDQLAEQRKQKSSVVPLNPLSSLENVLETHKENLQGKQIELKRDVPSIMSLILAEPLQLEALFNLILLILLEDCDSNGSTLDIVVKDIQSEADNRYISMKFSNQGYGVPQQNIDRLLQLLQESPVDLAQEGEKLEQLLLLVHQASYWGLQIDIHSALGDGYVIDLTIPVFMIH